eukprot:TRINITY_DN4971_c1_g1_i5.p1 TRINITY_DN4971_c1_g1~~TRINITY_DN4971_c1_g1_i5.p1  ORF type:complete len:695 (+),score=90.48 TRINITY_DN4971_c1_g1_i5:73-2157(+)
MKSMSRIIVILLFISLVVSESCLNNPVTIEPDEKKVILTQNPWDASSINANIAKILLEEVVGVPVEIRPIDEYTQWEKMSTGEVHATLEYWPSGHITDEQQYIYKDKTVVVAGPLGVIGQIGWYTQEFVLDQYPALTVSRSFADPNMSAIVNSTFWSGDPSWAQFEPQIISQYNYSLHVEFTGNESSLIDKLDSYVNQTKPLLFYFWSPHGIHGKYRLGRISLPREAENTYYPPDILKKAAWSGLEQYSPSAHFLVDGFTLSTQDQISMLGEMMNGASVYNVSCDWVRTKAVLWENWILPLKKYSAYQPKVAIPIALMVIAGVGILFSFILMTYVIYNRKKQEIHSSSWKFLTAIISGAVVGYVLVILICLTVFYPNEGLCVLVPVLFFIGYSIIYGCLIAKNYRIYLLWKAAHKLSKAVVDDWHVFKVVLGITAIYVAWIIVWLAIDRPVPTTILEPEKLEKYITCASQNVFWIYISILLTGALLAWGSYIAFQIRNISFLMNEPRYIGISIYGTIFFGIIGVILSLAIPGTPDVSIIFFAVPLLFAVTSVLLLIFIPKIFPETDPFPMQKTQSSSSASTAVRNEEQFTILIQENKELKSKLKILEDKFNAKVSESTEQSSHHDETTETTTTSHRKKTISTKNPSECDSESESVRIEGVQELLNSSAPTQHDNNAHNLSSESTERSEDDEDEE